MKTIKTIKFSKLFTFGFMNRGERDIPENTLLVYDRKFYGAVSHDDNLTMHGYTYGRYLIVHIYDRQKGLDYSDDPCRQHWHVFKFDKPAHLLDNCEAFNGRLQDRFKTLTAVKEWFLQKEK